MREISMDLSPNDVRNYEFSTQMRGYVREDVDNFLEHIAAAMEALKQENHKLSMEIDSVKVQLSGLRQFEDTIKNAAIDARRNADMTVANAKSEAELIVSRARTEVSEIIGMRARKVHTIEEEIVKLQRTKKSYLSKLHSLIKSHLDLLGEVTGKDSDTEDAGLEVTASSEVSRRKRETVGSRPEKLRPIRTEEANAADTIVPADTTADPDSNENTEGAVDPELAAALEKYQYKKETPDSSPMDTSMPPEPVPLPGEMFETTARAEDVPPDFISVDTVGTRTGATDKIATPHDDAEVSVVQQPPTDGKITADPPADGPDGTQENLAKELDKVVARFEEEMDKAEQN
ncbi:MAG: DivIVA domain-containing protein [bacterium]